MSDYDDTLLRTSLSVAVPLWIDQIRGWPESHRAERRAICVDTITQYGDVLLYKGKKKGESAEAFNRTAEGIALLAFAPGGVTIFGEHWEATDE